MIVAYYIEVSNKAHQALLEHHLRGFGFAFLDGTEFDAFTRNGNLLDCRTLEEIEAMLEGK